MSLSLPGGAVKDSATDQNFRGIAQRFPLQPEDIAGGIRNFGLVEALPTKPKPVVGDCCSYRNAAMKSSGIVWRLVYTGESEYPWTALDGRPLVSEVQADETTESTTYVNLATAGPTVTTPLKGDYDIEIECNVYFNPPANNCGVMSYAIGAAAASDEDRLEALADAGILAGETAGSERRKTSIPSGTAITAKYKVASKAPGHFRLRRLRINPVRVG